MEPSELELPIHSLSDVTFKFYNTDEIKSLSVKEILNGNIFDKLGHVTVGGLYDNALGPLVRDEVCSTCRELEMKCTGHMGHIQLPVLLYNPIYFRVLLKILSSACLNCHCLHADSVQAHLFKSQLTLLDYGIISEIENVTEYASFLMETDGSQKEKASAVIEKISEFVASLIKDKEKNTQKTKNIEALERHVINTFIKKQMVPHSKCSRCKKSTMKIRSEFNAKISLYSWSTYRTKSDKFAIMDPKVLRKKIQGLDDVEDNVEIDEEEGSTEKSKQRQKQPDRKLLMPLEAKQHMEKIWKKNKEVLKNLYHSLHTGNDKCMDIFFLEVLPVPPSAFRPMNVMNGRRTADPQTSNLNKVILQCSNVKQVLLAIKSSELDSTMDTSTVQSESTVLNDIPGNTLEEKLMNSWVSLQTLVNCVIDSSLDKLNKDKAPGIKQVLEKKEGLFRKNMMGKRVNYAARSVISPDPCIATSEIGIPEVFAKKLTYPETVFAHNEKELYQAVVNGPDVHPGANAVIMENGFRTQLSTKNISERIALAKRLRSPPEKENALMDPKTVLRHLRNGDVLLLNRQPTLHKPSIQAHKARVLPQQRTLRLHYSNCKAYNADFDGDEMNAHFPQSEKCRAEAYNLAATDYQYLVPKDGSPLGGLIQDSMISGVNLTMRGRVFCRADYCNLVFSALSDKAGKIDLLPPSILKPQRLWSGKQVFSTILLNVIPHGKKRINLTGKAKIVENSWIQQKDKPGRFPPHLGESTVIIRDGELLCGVLDKGHYGPTSYGLVHSCYELYGGEIAGKLLTSLGRLFTTFLQLRGFTLGIEDIKVKKNADKERKKVIEESQKNAFDVVCKALGLPENTPETDIVGALKKAHCSTSDADMKELDISMKSKTDNFQNRIVKCTMPLGLEKPFPHNNLQLMVQSGAKGSTVNCMQISSLLGQIELEGRRPPLMSSGKYLPSFELFDVSPAAGGFVTGRFLTGIKPQEYFFHCMAGREGLVDTAVKTSRSGYLQRCLIKHLEGLMVCYDMTVRDSDGSVIQFYYGNDGLDISKTPYFKPRQFGFLFENYRPPKKKKKKKTNSEEANEKEIEKLNKAKEKEIEKLNKSICKWREKNLSGDLSSRVRSSGFLNFCAKYGSKLLETESALESKDGRSAGVDILCNAWHNLSEKKKKKYSKWCGSCPDPVTSVFKPYQHLDVLPERFSSVAESYVKENLKEEKWPAFLDMIKRKYSQSLVEPGESVGLLCAQSIGEPSTQMTLNTFHFAGRGEMNVTLGIPRLREILMIASSKIKTPSMSIPVINSDYAKSAVQNLQKRLKKVTLSEVLCSISVNEYLSRKSSGLVNRHRNFRVKFEFFPPSYYKHRFIVSPKMIMRFMEEQYIKQLIGKIEKKRQQMGAAKLLASGKVQRAPTTFASSRSQQDDDKDGDMSDDDNQDMDVSTAKAKRRFQDTLEYEGEEEEMEEIRSSDDEDNMMISDVDEEADDKNGEADPVSAGDLFEMQKQEKIKYDDRVSAVLKLNPCIIEYKYEKKKELMCEVTIRLPVLHSKFDLKSLIEEDCKRVVLHQIPGIKQAFLSEKIKDGSSIQTLKTDGINIAEMFKYPHILDLHKFYCNDIHAMASTYGVEAAARVLIKEIQDVFGAYGITVDYRHLTVVADYMTFEGLYQAFNRRAIETNVSPLQKMSFETTMHFLIQSSINCGVDVLRSPSSQIVTGKNVSCGTGCFDILHKLITEKKDLPGLLQAGQ